MASKAGIKPFAYYLSMFYLSSIILFDINYSVAVPILGVIPVYVTLIICFQCVLQCYFTVTVNQIEYARSDFYDESESQQQVLDARRPYESETAY